MRYSGVYTLKLSEHLSRGARRKLFNLVREKVEERLKREKRGCGRPPVLRVVAAELGLSVATLKAWSRGHWQASNINAEKLLKKASELDQKRTLEILREDLAAYSQAIREVRPSTTPPD